MTDNGSFLKKKDKRNKVITVLLLNEEQILKLAVSKQISISCNSLHFLSLEMKNLSVGKTNIRCLYLAVTLKNTYRNSSTNHFIT